MCDLAIFPLYYFAPVHYYVCLQEKPNIFFDNKTLFIKQTYRNRSEILTAQGILRLVIPVKHKGKQNEDQIIIDYSENWPKKHLRSIETAYQSAPFFSFYKEDLYALYLEPDLYLWQFNLRTTKWIMHILGFMEQTKIYTKISHKTNLKEDFCKAFPNKKKGIASVDLPRYWQNFSDRIPFVPYLSILDLIFCKGPESTFYLKALAHFLKNN